MKFNCVGERYIASSLPRYSLYNYYYFGMQVSAFLHIRSPILVYVPYRYKRSGVIWPYLGDLEPERGYSRLRSIPPKGPRESPRSNKVRRLIFALITRDQWYKTLSVLIEDA